MTTTPTLPDCASTTTGPETDYNDICTSSQTLVREEKVTVTVTRESEPLAWSGAPLMTAILVALILGLFGAGLKMIQQQKEITRLKKELN
jgi:hypothetical protein